MSTTGSTPPSFHDLHDLDQGAVLLHVREVGRRGLEYATKHRPAMFFVDEQMCSLDRQEACRIAQSFGAYDALRETLGTETADRLELLAAHIGSMLDSCPVDVSTPRRRARAATLLAWLAEPGSMDGDGGANARRPYLLDATKAVFVKGDGKTFGHFEVR